MATIAAPSLSRVAALPALHLPEHRKPAKKKAQEASPSRRSRRAGHAHAGDPPRRRGAVPDGRPAAASSRPRAADSGGSGVRQDLRHLGMIRPRPARPSAAEPAVDGRRPRRGARRRPSAAGSSRTRSPPIRRRPTAPVAEGARRRPGAAEGLLGLAARAAAAGAARARRARPPGRPTPASRRPSRSRSCRPTTRRSCPPRWSRRPTAACRRPEKARVVGLEARAYRGVRTGDSVLDIYAIPTTRGVLTLVCAARSGGRGGADLVPERARPDHRRGRQADHARRRDRVPDARPGGPEGARRGARARAGRAAARRRARSASAAPRARSGGLRRRRGRARRRWRPRASRRRRVVASLRDTARAYRAARRRREEAQQARVGAGADGRGRRPSKTLKRRVAAA